MKKLTRRQQAFVAAKAQGHSGCDAAKLAGYAVPKQEASRLLQVPAVREALFQEREELIARRLAPKALAALEGILDDPDCQPAAKVRAATWILEASGHGLEAEKARRGHIPFEDKPLHQMTEAELTAVVERSRRALEELEGVIPVEAEAEEEKRPL